MDCDRLWRKNLRGGSTKYCCVTGQACFRSVHYGPKWKKHRLNSHPIIHCPMSKGMSEMSERAKLAVRREQAKWAVRSKRTNELCERMSERMSEWPSTSVCILSYSGPQCGGSRKHRVLSSFTLKLYLDNILLCNFCKKILEPCYFSKQLNFWILNIGFRERITPPTIKNF